MIPLWAWILWAGAWIVLAAWITRERTATVPENYAVEHGVCIHCDVPVIRWPDFSPQWMHNPPKGFRVPRCRGRTTVAEPKE